MKNTNFWLRAAAVLQSITTVFHAMSFLATPQPQNESERQLFDLMNNYQMNMGGMTTTMQNLFNALSACFALVFAFGAMLNFYLSRKGTDLSLVSGIIGIQVLIFGIAFAVMAALTFLPPILCSGLVFATLLVAYWRSKV
jgi:hypothetical protein